MRIKYISFLKFLCILTFLLLSSWLLTSNPSAQEKTAQESPCLTCHPDFKKPAKSVHAAMGMGCETCHMKVQGKEHPQDKGSVKLTQDMPELCYGCHDQSKFNGKVIHAPVAGGMCTSCHNPHKSDSEKLLVSNMPGLCYTCHDKAKFTRKNVHAAIPAVGCTMCHAPHASAYESLLSGSVNNVCKSCHVNKTTGVHIVALPGGKIHPISGIDPSTVKKWVKVPDPKNPKFEIDVPDPKNPGKEITCVSCHDPHSSDFRKLFVQDRICKKCHKSYY